MIARLVLGYVLAALVIIPHLTHAVGKESSYKLSILMTADVSGTLQAYYDIGQGLRETDSVAVALAPDRREYELPLPSGVYHQLRIDPGTTGGRYTIERAIIRGPDGSTYRLIPLTELRPVHQLSLIELRSQSLVVESPPGSNNPQLLYAPEPPFSLSAQGVGRLLGRLLASWVAGVFLIVLLELALRPVASAVSRRLQSAAHWAQAHKRGAVLGAAAIATVIVFYPVLFLNRSLVSPNNHGLSMLYDRVPFVPGSRDLDLENTRESDVGAMMWAFAPYATVQREALSQGELPLWNRFNQAGLPLWGQGQSFLGDPLHWLTFLDSDWGLDLKFVAHRFMLAAGVGLAGLAATGGWLPAAVAAVATPFIGVFIFRFNHPASFSLTYAPWILLAWFALAAAQTRFQMARAALLLTAASAFVLLASPPKDAIVMLAGCQAGGLLALLLCRKGVLTASGPLVWQRLAWQRLGFATLAGAATVTITAPHWIVFLETLSDSVTVYDQPRVDLWPLALAPRLMLGSLYAGMVPPALHITGMLLLIAALVTPSSLVRRPAILGCFIVAMCLLTVAFGAIPAAWLMRVPLVANIQQINYTTASTAVLLLSVVCASGAESILAASLLQTSILTSFVGLASALLLRFAAGVATDPSEPWIIGFLLVGLTAVPYCVRTVRSAPGRVLPMVSTLSLGMLLLLPGGLHVKTGMPPLDQLLAQPRPRADLDAMSPAVDAVHRVMTEPTRAVGLGLTLYAGTQALYGLEGIGGPDALFVRSYVELVNAAGLQRPSPGQWLTFVPMTDVERMAPLLDMLNVGLVLAPTGSTPPGLNEVPMQGPDLVKPWSRPTAWPRAFFTDGIGTYLDAQDLFKQVAARRKPLALIQSTDRRAMEATRGTRASSGEVVPARNYQLTNNTTTFVVRSPGPGLAVLTETFLPNDFRATLNGEHVPYFRVNHAFKAVAIPSAGEWTVKFEYRPHRWNVSLVIAGIGVALLVGLGLLAPRIAA